MIYEIKKICWICNEKFISKWTLEGRISKDSGSLSFSNQSDEVECKSICETCTIKYEKEIKEYDKGMIFAMEMIIKN